MPRYSLMASTLPGRSPKNPVLPAPGKPSQEKITAPPTDCPESQAVRPIFRPVCPKSITIFPIKEDLLIFILVECAPFRKSGARNNRKEGLKLKRKNIVLIVLMSIVRSGIQKIICRIVPLIHIVRLSLSTRKNITVRKDISVQQNLGCRKNQCRMKADNSKVFKMAGYLSSEAATL